MIFECNSVERVYSSIMVIRKWGEIIQFIGFEVSLTSTPKLDMVRSPSFIGSTYTGPLDFLVDQSSFNNIFGLAPEMLLITARSSRAIEEYDTLRSKLSTLCSHSQLHVFIISFSYNTLVLIFTIPIR